MNLTNLTNKEILSGESDLVKFLEMDSYYQLIESGEIKTDADKVECIRNSIELYLESE